MLKKLGFIFAFAGGLIFTISIANFALVRSVMGAEAETHAKEHKEEEHGMTGAEGEGGKGVEKVEHKHKEPAKGTGGEAETHAKEHKEEEHGMTGSEGEAGKGKK